MQNLEHEIQLIHERNCKVELDKAWEISLFRKGVIAVLTYFVMVLVFVFADLPKPFINAIVPTIAFLFSTLSLSFFKKIWLKYFRRI